MAVTFGETSELGGETQASAAVLACKYPSDQATNVQAICIYLKLSAHGNDTNVQCALYDANRNFIDETETKLLGTGQDSWVFFRFTSPPAVTASTNYLLAWNSDRLILTQRDTATNQTVFDTPVEFGSWPDPLDDVWANYRYSIYALGIPQPSVNDTVTVTDVLTDIIRSNARDISVNDSTTLSEFLNVIVLSISVNDSVTVSESVTVSMPSIAVQEYVKATLVCNINVNDTVSVSESVSILPLVLAGVSVNDTISIAEAITNVSSLADISVSDAITLAEYISSVASLADISVSEAVSILEKVYFEWWQGVIEPTPDWTDIEPDATPWTDLEPAETAWTDV